MKELYIDIGAASRAEAEAWGVQLGDPVVLVGPFCQLHNPDLLLARAWDNRVGCAIVIEVLRQLQGQHHPNEVYAGATVQEEVGLRGAAMLAQTIGPDIAFAVEAGIAGDTPDVSPDDARARLGNGPTILLYDSSMIPHRGLSDLVIDIATLEGIPLQFDHINQGGSDAGRFHVSAIGVPSLVITVPVRYIHTPGALLYQRDLQATVALLVAVIKRLDEHVLKQLIDPQSVKANT